MGIVRHKKLSKTAYNNIVSKDEDTLYVVNDNGDFSEENLEDSAELYIGDKRITPRFVGTPIRYITAVGNVTLKPDIKYMVNITADVNFLLESFVDDGFNHYYKIFLTTNEYIPNINFPTDILWANDNVFSPNSKYIITIEDNIASYVKVENLIYYSFSTAFSDDFKVFKG